MQPYGGTRFYRIVPLQSAPPEHPVAFAPPFCVVLDCNATVIAAVAAIVAIAATVVTVAIVAVAATVAVYTTVAIAAAIATFACAANVTVAATEAWCDRGSKLCPPLYYLP